MSAWFRLGIDPTPDVRAIKRAYGRKLKLTRPEDDPQGFQELNDAYQAALQMAPYIDADAEQDSQTEPAPQPRIVEPASVETAPQALLERAPDTDAEPAWAEPEAVEAAWERPVAAFREETWERPVPLLREVPDEAALRLQRQREREQEREQARAAARAASQAAFELAGQLWSGFLERSAVAPKHGLARLLESDELLNLEVREHLELFAVQYCAGEACGSELREAIVAAFGWEEDAAFVGRRLPDATGEALARLRASRDYHALIKRAHEPAIAVLLADTAGRRFGRTLRSGFTRALQQHIARIREFHRELLHFELNREVFEEWERRVDGRRYFLETALFTAALGLAPCFFGVMAAGSGNLDFNPLLLLLFLPLALGAGVAWAYYDPVARLRRTDQITHLVYDLRFRTAWQLGWIPAYALLSLLLFIPDPPALLATAVALGLIGCALVASFANSVMLEKVHYVFSAVVAVLFGAAMADKHFGGYGVVACIASAWCAMQVLYRGGEDLWSRMPERAGLLQPLRTAWLAGSIALVLGADTSLLPLQLHAAVCWLWVLGGMLLSNPTANYVAAAIGGVALAFGVSLLQPGAVAVRTMPMSMLVSPLFAVAIFMVVNMIRTKKNQHPFS